MAKPSSIVMPASLSCPKCGAPARAGADSDRCDYCGSALATVSCPSCFGAMFAGMQFCPSCGAKADRDVDEAARSLACPGCGGNMRLARVGKTPMYECESCASNWLDTETFAAMCADREERGAVASSLGTSASPVAVQPLGPVRYLPCPTCGKLMNRVNFGHRSGVIIDVCKGHGTWFQPHELRNALAFVDSGGFERARAEEAQGRSEEQRKLERVFLETAATAPHGGFGGRAGRDSGGPVDILLRHALEKLLS